VGKRISIGHTRKLLNAALGGALDEVSYRKDPVFGFEVPESCEGVPSEILEPANTWGNREEYYRKYDALAAASSRTSRCWRGLPPGTAAHGPKRLTGVPSRA